MADSPFIARPISDDEAAVVERMLEVAATEPSAPGLLAQVRGLQVVDGCGCGCASVDFRASTGGEAWRIVADASGTSLDGEPLGLLLWAVGGELAGLEVYGDLDEPARLPSLVSITQHIRPDGARMEQRNDSTDRLTPGRSRWLWLSAFATFAFFAVSSGKPVLAAGFLLIGVFAFFNDPLSPPPRRLVGPSATLAISWLCGLGGVIAVVATAVSALVK